MAKLAAKTYGNALLDLAKEENMLDTLFEEATALLEILSQNPDLTVMMKHPKITREEKLQSLKVIFEGKVSAQMFGFLEIVLEKDRFAECKAILEYFIDQVKEMKGIGVAYVTTAFELNFVQQNQIQEKLLATTKYQSMEMHYEVDPSIIGGMIIRIKDRVVDGSVKTKISECKKQLMKIQL